MCMSLCAVYTSDSNLRVEKPNEFHGTAIIHVCQFMCLRAVCSAVTKMMIAVKVKYDTLDL